MIFIRIEWEVVDMTEIINLIVNNGLAVVVCGYFMFTNYKFNEKLVSTLSAMETRLEAIEKEDKNE